MKTWKLQIFSPVAAILAIFTIGFIGCQQSHGGGGGGSGGKTPTAADYEIGNLTQTVGSITAVTVTPKSGKSTGAVTIYYNGSTTLPSAAGTYAVTFNVAAAKGWNAIKGLSAGTLSVSGESVSITPITSVSLTIIAPVRDEVPATTASGVVYSTAGTVIWSPPDNRFQGGKVYTASVTLSAASGYTFTGLTTAAINGQTAAISNNTGVSVTLSYTFPATDTRLSTGMSITAQPAKLTYSHDDTLNLTGLTVKLSYNDNSFDDIAVANFAARNITASPSHGDTLSVAAHNSKPVTISYGSHTVDTNALTVNPIAPVLADFIISELTQEYNGKPKTVTVTAKDGKTTGTVTVKYNGSTAAPSNAGTYAVTFDVTADTNYTVATGLSAGTLTIKTAVYALGDTGPGGGKIFYYSEAGFTMTDNNEVCHYLEAAPFDMSSTFIWSSTTIHTSSTSSGWVLGKQIGSGRKYTAMILAYEDNTTPTAARACYYYQGPNNLTGWFLPSDDELYELYKNKSSVGNMGSSLYWSSSCPGTKLSAWALDFSNGNWKGSLDNANGNATTKYSVRAVRAF